ncbi:hypothetical protein [Treponema zioleckii]|uniref:hypothetical protein n=1 Tax=Treponema zioleckii TaxID=331680 RepID=UPI00168B321D|nr:hypothetical protein [Treponema zioleckii]
MATTTNILSLLKFFASKQKSAIIDYYEFSEYIRKYAEHHIEEVPQLEMYLRDLSGSLENEFDKLILSKQIVIFDSGATKQSIIVIPFYIEKVAERYTEIAGSPVLPFPSETDLPKKTPREVVTRESASDLIGKFLDHQNLNDSTLYGLVLPHEAPAILFPSSISIKILIEDSLAKLQYMLRKDEYHDYFIKKISISNPGKEMTSKNFLNAFIDRQDATIDILSESTDNFYLWHQLCYFIKQDFEKVKDFTQEDTALLQAVYVLEIASNYFKNKAVVNTKKQNALKCLEQLLDKPPYYFTYETIASFTDTNGIPLLGQFSEDELKDFLHEKTQGGDSHELPELLVFKVADNEKRYFILKSKVLQLILRLCTDARTSVREAIKQKWQTAMKNFEVLPEMHEQAAFEACLENEIEIQSPILHALLTASFLPLLSYEKNSEERITLFAGGSLMPYSELLLMSRQDLYNDTKILLPFWYTLPVFSWIAKLILRPPKSKRRKAEKTSAEIYHENESKKSDEDAEMAMIAGKHSSVSKKVALREAAREAESSFVPASSTLDRELDSYLHMWNKLIGKTQSDNLTEDVNCLIRDYIRTVLRTMKPSGFTPDRVNAIAATLCKAPAMQKIGEHDALLMYTKLYIVKLVKNIPTLNIK